MEMRHDRYPRVHHEAGTGGAFRVGGARGVVASTHWFASAAGMAVLEKDGNAFDAAVAAGLVLQVVEPHLNGPGGEVPIIAYDQQRGETFVVSGQGPAGRDRARVVRRVDAAAARVWSAAAARGHELRDRVRRVRVPHLARD